MGGQGERGARPRHRGHRLSAADHGRGPSVRNLADARGAGRAHTAERAGGLRLQRPWLQAASASFADTYGMLAKGTVNGQEGCFNNVVTMKFADHQKYATCINYAVHSANIIVNEEWLQGLPEQARDALIARAGKRWPTSGRKVSPNACRG